MDLMISPRKICNDDHSMAKVLCKPHLEKSHLGLSLGSGASPSWILDIL